MGSMLPVLPRAAGGSRSETTGVSSVKGTAGRNTTIPAAAAQGDNNLQEVLENNLKKKSDAKAGRWDHKEKRPPPDREGCNKSIVVLPRCPSRC